MKHNQENVYQKQRIITKLLLLKWLEIDHPLQQITNLLIFSAQLKQLLLKQRIIVDLMLQYFWTQILTILSFLMIILSLIMIFGRILLMQISSSLSCNIALELSSIYFRPSGCTIERCNKTVTIYNKIGPKF